MVNMLNGECFPSNAPTQFMDPIGLLAADLGPRFRQPLLYYDRTRQNAPDSLLGALRPGIGGFRTAHELCLREAGFVKLWPLPWQLLTLQLFYVWSNGLSNR